MGEEKWIRSEVKELIVYLAIGIFMLIILPIFGGFILRGFEEGFSSSFNVKTYLGAFIVYFFLMIGALSLIIFPISRLIALKRNEHPALQSNPSWFTIFTVSLIHSPEENGALYRMFEYFGLTGKRNPMRFTLSAFRIFIVSVILFGFLGILQLSFPQLNVAGVPDTPQQITAISDIIFGASVPAFAENGVLLFVFFILLGVDAYICSKFKLGLGSFFAIGFILIIPICALFWMSFHGIVYGNSEIKLFSTFLFALIGLVITLLISSFIPFLVWHFMNNAFIKLSNVVVSNADTIFIAIVIWILILIAYISGEILAYRIRKRRGINIPITPN